MAAGAWMPLVKVIEANDAVGDIEFGMEDVLALVLTEQLKIDNRHKTRVQLLAIREKKTGVITPFAIRAVTGHSGVAKMGKEVLFNMLKPFTLEMAMANGGHVFHVTSVAYFYSIMNKGLLAENLPSFVNQKSDGRGQVMTGLTKCNYARLASLLKTPEVLADIRERCERFNTSGGSDRTATPRGATWHP